MIKYKLAHLGLSCKNVDATKKFYTEYFGFKESRVIGNGDVKVVIIKSESNDLVFELFESKEAAPASSTMEAGPNYPGFKHLAFLVENVDETLEKLRENVRVTLDIIDFGFIEPGWKSFFIADPDDRIIEITSSDMCQ